LERVAVKVAFDGGDTIEVTMGWGEILRLERLTGIPYPELAARGFVGTPYKLAWLALQAAEHPSVLPHYDLRVIPEVILNVGAEEFASIATVEME
jgi:hypothetical protein